MPGLSCLVALGLSTTLALSQTTGAPPPRAAAAASRTAPAIATTPLAATAPAASSVAAPATASPLNPARDELPRTEPVPGAPNLDALMSRVAALRSRIAALTATLFSSKLRIELRAAGDSVRLEALRVSLDGGVLYTAPAQTFFERAEVIYEHAVAPGPHVLGIEVERRDLRQPQFSTWQLSRFVVVVPEQRTLWTRVELDDESSMGEDFAEDEAGQYELRVRLEAEVVE